MKIICEFESMEEFEAFRVSGKKTRTKKEEVEEAVELQASKADPTVTVTPTSAPQPIAPVPAPPPAPMHGFPGGNGNQDPRVTQILARIDGALSSGQSTDNIVTWFRQQIGPEAANATLEQIKQVFIPRLTEAQLNQIAPLLGFQRG